MGTETNRRALFEALESFNRGDLDRYMELYAPGCTVHGFAPEPLDHAGLRAFYEMLFAAFPDGRVTVDETVGEDDRLAGRYTFRATHRGELMGIPPSGNSVVMSGQTMFHFENGKVVERWQNADMLGLMQQIGAIPAAV